MEVDEELNLLGVLCPEPVFRTRNALEKLKEGQVLKVMADDPAAEDDLKRWTKRTGNQLLGVERKGGQVTIYIRKSFSPRPARS